MSVVALDVGDKTIGVAITDELGMTAQGVGVIRRKGYKHDFPALEQALRNREIERFLVGWPLNMDGSEGERALRSRRFAQALKERVKVPVLLWDERLSTWEATQALQEDGLNRKKRREVVDMLAAQFILRSWMDAGQPDEGEAP